METKRQNIILTIFTGRRLRRVAPSQLPTIAVGIKLVENNCPEATVTNVLEVAGLSSIIGCLLVEVDANFFCAY